MRYQYHDERFSTQSCTSHIGRCPGDAVSPPTNSWSKGIPNKAGSQTLAPLAWPYSTCEGGCKSSTEDKAPTHAHTAYGPGLVLSCSVGLLELLSLHCAAACV
eukprot:g57515.t1